MPRIIQLAMGQDSSIFVEVDDRLAQGTQRIAADSSERALEKVVGNLEGAMANIHRLASDLYEALSRLPRAPETAEVEFGVKLTGGAGIIIASGTAEANIKITLSWKAPTH